MMFLRTRMLTAIMKASSWSWLLWLGTIDSLDIYVNIGADSSWNFRLWSALCQDMSFIGSVVLGSIDLGYYQLFPLRIIEAKVEMDVVESCTRTSGFSFNWIGIEHALWSSTFFLGFDGDRFAAFTSMRGMFGLKTWWLCVVGMVKWLLVSLYGSLTVFLNILVSKRHML